MLCGFKYMAEKTQPDLIFCLFMQNRRESWGKDPKVLVATAQKGLVQQEGNSLGVMGGIALSWDRAGLSSHWWHHKVLGVLLCRAGNFLANSSFFTNLKQMHIKVFCSSSFVMCSRNSVTFRLPVAEDFPLKCMDDSGE